MNCTNFFRILILSVIKWPWLQGWSLLLFKNMIVIRYCGANETADYCCIFGHFDLLYYGKLDSLCDITIKLVVFVALQAFDLKDFLEVSMIKWKVNNHLGINLKITYIHQ